VVVEEKTSDEVEAAAEAEEEPEAEWRGPT
jgi:hypothetical protein